jgi:hypothetical protein
MSPFETDDDEDKARESEALTGSGVASPPTIRSAGVKLFDAGADPSSAFAIVANVPSAAAIVIARTKHLRQTGPLRIDRSLHRMYRRAGCLSRIR